MDFESLTQKAESGNKTAATMKAKVDEIKKTRSPSKDEHPETAHDGAAMDVKVYSPYQVYFDDQAYSVSAVNDTGPFDVLPQHHRFLTLLSPCEVVIAGRVGEERIKISRGVMYVKEDKVTVFLDV